MTPVRLLIVKTSSMGDVVHALPVVADIRRHHPEARIDWLAEPAFAAIAHLHPAVDQVWLLPWRRWRRGLLQPQTWRAMAELRKGLRARGFDRVLDLQGLLKSALWARQTGRPVCGYDRRSLREPLAALLYDHVAAVSRQAQAIQRCRALAAAHLGYAEPQTPPEFGLRLPSSSSAFAPASDYAVLIPNASRPEKLWPEASWMAVGQRLRAHGCLPVVLWGSEAERAQAGRIAAGCAGEVPPFLSVGDMAGVLAGARQVVGLDTGFTHLAAALGRPTLGIYCDHEPGLAGITGPGPVASTGGKGQSPAVAAVLALLEAQRVPAA